MIDDLPLAKDLEDGALAAKHAGHEKIVVELPWRAGLTIAEALRAYFDAKAPMRCFVCDQARDTDFDVQLDYLTECAGRLSYLLSDIEQITSKQTGHPVLTRDEIVEADIREDVITQQVIGRRWVRPKKSYRIEASASLRAVVRSWSSPPEPMQGPPPKPRDDLDTTRT